MLSGLWKLVCIALLAKPVVAFANPTLLKDIYEGPLDSAYRIDSDIAGSRSSIHKISEDFAVFIVSNSGGPELWKTDGTSAGTTLLKAMHGSSPQAAWGAVVSLNEFAYFVLDGVLWRTDGSEAGTKSYSLDVSPYSVALLGNTFLLSAYSSELSDRVLLEFRHDTETVELVKQFCDGLYILEQGAVYQERIYFAADDCNGAGIELWSSDGTASGTVLEKDIKVPSGEFLITNSFPSNFRSAGDKLYFSAESTESGKELWVVNGDSVSMVVDYRVGTASAFPVLHSSLGDSVLFTSWHGAVSDGVRRLSISDGSSGGTVLVSNSKVADGPSPVVFGSHVYYVDFETKFLRKSAGNVGSDSAVSSVQIHSPLVASGNRVFYNGKANATGIELHAYDAFADVEWLVSDISAGTTSSLPEHTIELNGRLIFFAGDGSHGREPWVLDLSQVSPPIPPSSSSGGGGGGGAMWSPLLLALLGLRMLRNQSATS